ncbi:hypothetical protein IWX90DRAFT_44447 [Phyllosticta citrichinensis]|uniref:Enoyl reductase (ER) domain-containing protein n=1 Tax=Phyllosticta citrichinensis TaxID=1130410 RepID=A0ABR1Y8F0_9PEZI
MSVPTSTRQWVLSRHPTGLPVLDGPEATFSLQTVDLPPIGDNQVLVRTRYFSNDPAQRGWIGNVMPERMYIAPVKLGEFMKSGGIAEIVESKAAGFEKGKLVTAFALGWREYAVLDAKDLSLVPEVEGIKETQYLGALGFTGLTGYYGIKEIAEAKPEHVVVVSGAAGATGSMAVQIAKKLIGCKKVIGIAGDDSKCAWVKSIGADECLNYKSPTFRKDLKAATPDYADVYFDNVGGEILDMMLPRMKQGGVVAVCGAISAYNSTEGQLLRNWSEVITMRLQMKGFIMLDFLAQGKAKDTVMELATAAKQGKLTIGDENETVVEAKFEDVPKTWLTLFEGGNTGKLVTKL